MGCVLVRIALFSSLSRRGLGTRIEGPRRQKIFKLIRGFFFDWPFESKEILNGSQNVRADCWRENMKVLCTAAINNCNGGNGEFGRKLCQLFIFTA